MKKIMITTSDFLTNVALTAIPINSDFSLGPLDVAFERLVNVSLPNCIIGSIAMPIVSVLADATAPLNIAVELAGKLLPEKYSKPISETFEIVSTTFSAISLGSATFGVGAAVVVGIFIIKKIGEFEKRAQLKANAKLQQRLKELLNECKEKADRRIQKRWARADAIAEQRFLYEKQHEHKDYYNSTEGIILGDLKDKVEKAQSEELPWLIHYWTYLYRLEQDAFGIVDVSEDPDIDSRDERYALYLYYQKRYSIAAKSLTSKACPKHGKNCSLLMEIKEMFPLMMAKYGIKNRKFFPEDFDADLMKEQPSAKHTPIDANVQGHAMNVFKSMIHPQKNKGGKSRADAYIVESEPDLPADEFEGKASGPQSPSGGGKSQGTKDLHQSFNMLRLKLKEQR